MANRYWVGGTGTWDNTAGSKWAATSGGAGGQSVPTSTDAVFFDANSGSSSTITLAISPTIYSLTMGTFNGNFDGVGSLYTITLTGVGVILDPCTFMLNKPNFTLSSTSASVRYINGNSQPALGKLIIGGASGTLSTTFQNGASYFKEISNTTTATHIISFAIGIAVDNWYITGASGNPVTLQGAGAIKRLVAVSSTDVISMDYMSIKDFGFDYTLNATTPYRAYAGSNSTNLGNTQGILFRPPTVKAYLLTLGTGTSWTVPADWNSANNTIHLIGAGGGGGDGDVIGSSHYGGGGGGGGGYRVINNFSTTPATNITYAIGLGGSPSTNGGNTTWNSGANIAGGGLGGSLDFGGSGGTGTFAGGAGGNGESSSVLYVGVGGSGGGGAGGPNGIGGTGGRGFASTTSANVSGGGGGGNGGGSVGANGTSGVGGTGGNNSSGTGGGTSITRGTLGGGGGGGVGSAGNTITGGPGIDIANTIGGSGGGGGITKDFGTYTNDGYGGGGAGGSVNTSGTRFVGGTGAPGVILITYTPAPQGGMYLLF
jgi:hypothetical protein